MDSVDQRLLALNAQMRTFTDSARTNSEWGICYPPVDALVNVYRPIELGASFLPRQRWSKIDPLRGIRIFS